MAERPILMSAPMVRAILSGAKTQTRRVVKHVKFVANLGSAVGRTGGGWLYGSPASLGLRHNGDHWSVSLDGDHLRRMCTREAYGWGAGAGCPYGQPGDLLWVREAFFHEPADYCWEASVSIPCRPALTVYRADYEGETRGTGWKPSIHMPRSLSRITLRVTDVRVERLQDISEADAQAEGALEAPLPMGMMYSQAAVMRTRYREGFGQLWCSINGAASWDANPWVWALTFERIGGANG